MRGFRNIVVHRYGAIDDALAFGLLTGNIGDFSEFVEDIEGILKKNTGEEFLDIRNRGILQAVSSTG